MIDNDNRVYLTSIGNISYFAKWHLLDRTNCRALGYTSRPEAELLYFKKPLSFHVNSACTAIGCFRR